MKTTIKSALTADSIIALRHVKSVIQMPWRGRYAAVTRAGDSLLLHISKSTTYSIKNLSARTKLGQDLVGSP